MTLLGITGLEGAVEINSGGFGVIYRAYQPAFDRTVAVKVLREPLGDAVIRRRFERECKALGALSGHPYIITVHDSGVNANGRPYLVMEYMAAGSLADRLRRAGRLPWQEVMDIAVKVAGGLHTAHRAEVLHRDLKPENILVSNFGEPKLADFGIAQIKRVAGAAAPTMAATFAHAAPELFDNVPPSVQSDLYGLGSTLFELLAGRAAFARDTDESFLPMLLRISVEPVPDLRPEGVPDQVCAIVERLMAKKPQDRFASAEQVGLAIQQLQRDAGLPVTRLTVDHSSSSFHHETTGHLTQVRRADPTYSIGHSDPQPEEPTDAPPMPVTALKVSASGEGRVTGIAPSQRPAEPSTAIAPPPDTPCPSPRRRSRRPVIAIIAILVLAAVGVATVATMMNMRSSTSSSQVELSKAPIPGVDPQELIMLSLRNPQRVAVDADGNLYIADTGNHRVQRVDPSGRITRVAGTGTFGFSGDNGPAITAQLSSPVDVAVDTVGNLYIADTGNHRVRRVDPSGTITTVAGSDVQGFAGGGGSAIAPVLNTPMGVALDASGNLLYIADYDNHWVGRVDLSSSLVGTVAGTGARGFSGDGGPATDAQLQFPTDVTVDDDSNVYIADRGNHRVRRVDPFGTITTVVGSDVQGFAGDSGPALAAQLTGPTSAAVDDDGNLYIADALSNRVRRVDPAGVITPVASNGITNCSGSPATAAALNRPAGVAVDGVGNLYIADTDNNRVCKMNRVEINAVARQRQSSDPDTSPAESS